MAPPRGDTAAAASASLDLTGVHILEASMPPPLPECGGNAAERKEEGDKNRKKEKAETQRITGWGLREYSKIVCEKVEAKGRTTYNEVADEVYSELKSMAHIGQGFEEKNVRRRVYDAFNVLIALRVIAKEKKEIKWMGLSNYRYETIKKLEFAKNSTTGLRTRRNSSRKLENSLMTSRISSYVTRHCRAQQRMLMVSNFHSYWSRRLEKLVWKLRFQKTQSLPVSRSPVHHSRCMTICQYLKG
ncbi:transcription factor-like protein DPB isoform X2 [Brachypodium distachyon]|uniref:transcription factor-like protein DPB isoform X2 n=1 Tax=Brachypodium distachyon TaxID=15368 RepID=UPI000D0DDC97|nr:transcription factor-like protein DPB isoform X2 [Brachypodium distachyon]|eukprot:XP_024315313.1 transcription factor-like protein DPB isoform X2 [Brachypodium distachyon]